MHHPSIIRDLNGRKVSSLSVDQVVDKALEAFSDQQLFRALTRRGALGIVASLSETENDEGPGVLIDDCVVVNLEAFKDAASRCIDEDDAMRKSIIAALEDAENTEAECPCPACEMVREAEAIAEQILSASRVGAQSAAAGVDAIIPGWSEAMATISRLDPIDRGDIVTGVLEAVAAKLEEIATRDETPKH